MRNETRRLAILAMIGAMAYVVMVFGRVPLVLFLKYDPKDVLLTLGGFIYGPAAAAALSALVSFVEMFTVSSTGIIGFLMNVLASCGFACTAAWIYNRRRDFFGAAFGLLTGVVVMTAIMLVWNYLLTPLFLGIPRQEIIKLLWKAILPFNLVKGGINAFLTMGLYRPLLRALSRARLISDLDLRPLTWQAVALWGGFGLFMTAVLLVIGR